MNYYSCELVETFTTSQEREIFANTSIIQDLERAHLIVMKTWLFHYMMAHKEMFKDIHVCLIEDCEIEDTYQHYLDSLLIKSTNPVSHPMNSDYILHRLVLLNNNRICLISKSSKDYRIDVFAFLKVDRFYETEETIKWLLYKLAFDNSPVSFANEKDYYSISL
ncbi:MAG: hypothetical protein EOM50_06195 [Erysipelotrichia bacterium]|nr:hypothetical protein [Erysipelotrichia bacterium]NCC54870.1 hypothetical protein [Erysipelotrichia bacterium]